MCGWNSVSKAFCVFIKIPVDVLPRSLWIASEKHNQYVLGSSEIHYKKLEHNVLVLESYILRVNNYRWVVSNSMSSKNRPDVLASRKKAP